MMHLIKAEIIRGAYPGVFRVTLCLQNGYYILTREHTGTLEECRVFVKDICEKEVEDA